MVWGFYSQGIIFDNGLLKHLHAYPAFQISVCRLSFWGEKSFPWQQATDYAVSSIKASWKVCTKSTGIFEMTNNMVTTARATVVSRVFVFPIGGKMLSLSQTGLVFQQ